MKLEVKDIVKKFAGVGHWFQRYAALLVILIVAASYGFLVWRINTYAGTEPTDDAVTEKLAASRSPKIDQKTIDKITQLQATNVEVRALFQHARDNPFQD